MRIVVIGGGLAGLSAAALLAYQGHTVTVLEKNTDLGGRARVWKSKGFTFDLGPSWYTMPEMWERLFGLMGKDIADYVDLRRLNPLFKVYFEGGKNVLIKDDLLHQKAVFDAFEKQGGTALERHLQTAHKRYALASEILYRSYKLPDLGDLGLVWRMRSSGIFSTLGHELAGAFESTEAQKILGFGTVFLGGSPDNLAGLFSLLNHAIFSGGVYYPMGGMGELVKALVRICKEHGVTIKTGEEVQKFHIPHSMSHTTSQVLIANVQTNKGIYTCDVVVSGADYWFTETQLLPQKLQSYPEAYWKRKILSPSAYCLYLGVKGKLPMLEHHTMYFSDAWNEHFRDVFLTKQWPTQPSVYVSTPSKTDPKVAPKDHENVFVLVPIPAGVADTREHRDRMKLYVWQVLRQITGVDVHKRVVVEREMSIADFARDYNTYHGSAFGLANTLFQTAWFRPQLRSQRVHNLYYVGQNTQPGIGMPMCAISAELVATAINEH